MSIDEFVGLSPDIIRRDKELMQLYINFYEAAFSIIPNCVGCSFKSGFRKLKQFAKTDKKSIKFDTNTKEMKTTKTFLLKPQFRNKILNYTKDGKVYRSYGYNLTEEFAEELVNAGKSDNFSALPKEKKTNPNILVVNKDDLDIEIKSVSKYDSMDYHKEILPLYTEVKGSTGKQAESKKQADIIAFLKANES